MRNHSPYKTVITAFFAALVCVSTLIHIALPTTNGYVNLGDGFILLSAFLLSPAFAFCAGGLGAALADVLNGYMNYAPGTLLIKGGMALVACALCRAAGDKRESPPVRLLAGLVADVFMCAGYYLYECTALGFGHAAAVAIPANFAEGLVGIAIALAAAPVLEKNHELREKLSCFHT